jgi:predicted NBD/HSP70 family sugar kinase
VLKVLRDDGPTSRTRLSAITGLSPTTITKTVAPLIELGLLTERADEYGGLGRPALSLIPVPDALSVCGVQIGVGRFRIGMTDARGAVRSLRTSAFDPALPPAAVLDLIASEISDVLGSDGGAPCIGVGVGAPGPVDAARRTNLLAVNLGWHDVAVSDHLEDRLGIPVVTDHNVRSFALGEARFGDHGAESIAYVYVRAGVGFGLAVRGEPFSGGTGTGGESYLGHLRVVEDGLLCSCGARGCLDTVVAEPYLAPVISRLRGRPAGTEVMRDLDELVATGVDGAAELQARIVGHLADALATVANLFTPDLVLVGGTLSALSPESLELLDRQTRDRIFPLLRESLRIETADGGDEALVRGAAAIALEVLHYS